MKNDYPAQTKAAQEQREYYLKLDAEKHSPAQPSPLPWSLKTLEFGAIDGILDANGELIQWLDVDFTNNQGQTNAAFIVTACNNHAALVEALRELLPLTEDINDRGPRGEGWQSDELMQAIEKAKAALTACGAE